MPRENSKPQGRNASLSAVSFQGSAQCVSRHVLNACSCHRHTLTLCLEEMQPAALNE